MAEQTLQTASRQTTNSPHPITVTPRIGRGRSSLLLLVSLVLAIALFGLLTPTAHAQDCTSAACVSTTGRLTALDTQDSATLNALLGALLGEGTALTLDAADYNALATTDVTLGDLLDELEVDLAVATPEEVLATGVSLPELLGALDAVSGGANIGIDALQPLLAGTVGDIVLGDLLTLEFSPDSLANSELNLLELATGSVQLFNSSNTVLLNPVTVNGADLGIADVGPIELRASVLEPPEIVCGPAGSLFRSANIRVALDIALLDVDLGGDDVAVGTLTADLGVTLAGLNLYVDVASGSGVIDAINAIAPSATISATPGVANLYIGEVAGDTFFEPGFDPATDLISGTVGSITATVSTDVVVPVVVANVTGDVLLRAVAEGDSGAQSHTFAGPFPELFTFTSSASSASTLLAELVANLELGFDLETTALGGLPITVEALEDLLEGVLGGLVEPLISDTVLDTILASALTELVDPLLAGVGVGLGEMDVIVRGVNGDTVFEICATGEDDDGDGIPNDVECPDGPPCPDTDGDGIPDQLDPDDDGDGVPTATECPEGPPCPDTDGDGTPDYLDPDDDGDGVYTIIECTTPAACQDTDGDGTPDYLDNDDDGDGLTTNVECPAGRTSSASPPCPDSDGDTIPDYLDAIFDGPGADDDDDGDGITNGEECPNGAPCPDTDGDGTPDPQDADDDGDGVPTAVECPEGLPCPDTDGDGTPDYRDPDDDGDGVYTVIECPGGWSSTTPCRDTDGDTVRDYLDDNDDNDASDTRTECPAGRVTTADPSCPALANGEIPDYLNPDFARYPGSIFGPMLLHEPEIVGPNE